MTEAAPDPGEDRAAAIERALTSGGVLPDLEGAALDGEARLAGRDLRGLSLREVRMDGADLTSARLDEVPGTGGRFVGATVEQASFARADLTGADFSGVHAGQADFSGALLEDSRFAGAGLRFARFEAAVLDGADFAGADMWGATLRDAEAQNVSLRGAHLEEADLAGAGLEGADLDGATLKRADLRRAKLQAANLQGTRLDGAKLDGADLSRASLPNLNLLGCSLVHVRLAGAWLERTQLTVDQLGGAVGEERAGEFAPAREAYLALEHNFRSLGHAEARSWAFKRRRRMGKRAAAAEARTALLRRDGMAAARAGTAWAIDVFTEFLCDYGESPGRVVRAFLLTLGGFAAFYWASGSLVAQPGSAFVGDGLVLRVASYLTYSLTMMTTVGAADIGLHPANGFVYLLTSLQTIIGTVLLGLFGFVLGAKMSE